MLAGPQRHMALVGGARSGKTFLFVLAIVARALNAPYSRHAIIRFRENAVWKSIGLDTLPKVMRTRFPGVQYVKRRQDGYFLFPNGSEIWLFGLDDKERTEKILGQEFATLYFNECSQIKYGAVLLALTRLAQEVTDVRGRPLKQRAYYDLNPLGKGHWTNRLFGEKRDPVTMQPLEDPDDYVRLFVNPEDNAENLSEDFLNSLRNMPERQRKRFYEGVYVDENEGALWTYEMLERCRLPHPGDANIKRVVVAVDASGASSREDLQADEIGIVVVALGTDGHGYVLADRSCRESPAVWGKVVAKAAEDFGADCVVAEKNFGGDMVRFVIKTANPKLLVRMVTASRGKTVRAEPVSALYGDDKTPPRVHHVERFPQMEDQMVAFTTMGYMGEDSPDRVDAVVWALTELMLVGVIPVIVPPVIITAPIVPFGTHEGYG
jgi:phage terminase large subunit-like protein